MDSTKGNNFDYAVLKRLLQFVKPYKWQFFFLTFIITSAAVLSPVIPFLISKTINNELVNADYEGLLKYVMLMLGVLFAQSILTYINTFLSGWLGQTIIRDIRVQLYQHILKLRLKFFDRTPIGQLVTRNISDIEALAEVFSQGLAAMVAELLQLVVIISFMFYQNWQLTLVSLSMFPILIYSTYVFKEKVKSSYDAVRTAVSRLNTFVQEHVTGMNVVQIFNKEKREHEKFQKINQEHLEANLRSVKYYSIYFPVADVIGAIGIGMLLWYGAHGLIKGVVTNIGDLIAFIMYINMFFRPIRLIADRFNTLQMGIISTSRIAKLLDNEEIIQKEGKNIPYKFDHSIDFKNVWFAYNEPEYVLKNLSFTVNKGESIAFVGATGAGKSSVVSLLNRLYEIQKGSISIDGVSIDDFNLNSVRKKIGVVLQDVFLFSESIRENITLGNPEITDDKLWEAARLVGAENFIKNLPGQFDYNVRERGISLSVGQRQLISFIRAMVYNPEILVLDEATSSVDTETEGLIQNAIATMMEGRTSLVIAHRLSTIQHADKIIVLDKGEIKEMGTHAELLELDGFYTQLYNMQYKMVS